MKSTLRKSLSLLTLSAVLACPAIPAFAETSPASDLNLLQKTFQTYPLQTEKISDKNADFKIFYVDKDNHYRRIDQDFTYPVKVLNNRTALALRDIESILNIHLTWDNDHRLVVADNRNSDSNTKQVVYPIDRRAYSADGKVKALDTSATIYTKYSRTYLPIRSISETLGYQIEFQETKRNVWVGDKDVDMKEAIKEFNKNDVSMPKPQPKPQPQPQPNPTPAPAVTPNNGGGNLGSALVANNGSNPKNPYKYNLRSTNGKTYEFDRYGAPVLGPDDATDFVPIDGPTIDGKSMEGTKPFSWLQQNYPGMAKVALQEDSILKNYRIRVLTPTTKILYNDGRAYAYPILAYGGAKFSIMSESLKSGEPMAVGTTIVMNGDGTYVADFSGFSKKMVNPRMALFTSSVLSDLNNVMYFVDYSSMLK